MTSRIHSRSELFARRETRDRISGTPSRTAFSRYRETPSRTVFSRSSSIGCCGEARAGHRPAPTKSMFCRGESCIRPRTVHPEGVARPRTFNRLPEEVADRADQGSERRDQRCDLCRGGASQLRFSPRAATLLVVGQSFTPSLRRGFDPHGCEPWGSLRLGFQGSVVKVRGLHGLRVQDNTLASNLERQNLKARGT
jgi:hypothetical protein